MDIKLNYAEIMTIRVALSNREKFLILQINGFKYSPKILKYYEHELNKVKELQKELNFYLKKIPFK